MKYNELEYLQINNKIMQTKSFWQSRTVLIAILQGVIGVLAALFATNPALAQVGYLAIIKTVLDITLRLSTISIIE